MEIVFFLLFCYRHSREETEAAISMAVAMSSLFAVPTAESAAQRLEIILRVLVFSLNKFMSQISIFIDYRD